MRSSASLREVSGRLCRDAHAPIWLPWGREAN